MKADTVSYNFQLDAERRGRHSFAPRGNENKGEFYAGRGLQPRP
jgi:hypothetical protein